MNFRIFTPVGATKTVSMSTSTARVALALTGERTVRVLNNAATVAFINFGNSAVEAATTDLPVAAGATEVFEINPATTHVAAILATDTGAIYFTEGQGA